MTWIAARFKLLLAIILIIALIVTSWIIWSNRRIDKVPSRGVFVFSEHY